MIDRNLDPAEMTRLGIAAARAGRKEEGRNYLLAAVEADERQEQAWLWLGGLVEDLDNQIICLENALDLNPGNEAAQRKLAQLRAKQGTAPANQPPPPSIPPPAIAARPAPSGSTQPAPSPFGSTQPAPSPFGAQPPPSPFSLPPLAELPTQDLASSGGPAVVARRNEGLDEVRRLFAQDQAAGQPDYQPLSSGAAVSGGWGSQQGTGATDQLAPTYTREMSEGNDALNYSPFSQREGAGGSNGSSLRQAAYSYDYAGEEAVPTYSTGGEAAHYAGAGEAELREEMAEKSVDERLECPYCGWVTQISDEICPNCKGDLYVEYRTREGRSSSIKLLAVFWLIEAGLSALTFLGSYLLMNMMKSISSQLPGLQYQQAQTVQRSFIILAVVFGIQIVISLGMMIGTLLRVRVFYYLNIGAVVLSVCSTLVTFFLAGARDVTAMVVGMVINPIIFYLITNSEDDFVPQRRRVIAPDSPAGRTPIDHYNAGATYQQAGYTALAAKEWRRAVGGSPANPQFRLTLASAYMQMKRIDLAEQEVKETLRFDPSNLRALNLIALILSRSGRYPEAERYIQTALQIKPGEELTLATQKTIEQEMARESKRDAKKVKV